MNEETPETMARGEMPTGENVPHERCPRQPLATERLDAETVGEAVYDAIRQCAVTLRPDFRKAVEAAREEAAPESREAGVLDRILENARIGATDGVPICQDTGMACVFIELGQDAHIDGDLADAVNEGVRRGYEKAFLRKSITADPLQRVNTGDNTPAFLTVHLVPGSGCKITVAPKGAGSENMSRLAMLKPADGVEGVKKFVLDTVEQAGANPCPPIVLGIGIGGSFDHCAALAKKALLRPLDEPNADPYYAALEKELLDAINATGFGPQGFGGATTCLGIAIEQKPTHVACLPVAVNISCHVTRRASRTL